MPANVDRNVWAFQSLAYLIPLLPLPVMAGVFALVARRQGAEAGYLLGFGFCWRWRLLIKS